MRLLVLDGSRILVSLVHRLAPGPVEVEEAGSFESALDRLKNDPPDALIVNVSPVDLPWEQLTALCSEHNPKIPVLLESCVYESPIEAGFSGLNGTAEFLYKPYDLENFKDQLIRLFDSRSIRPLPARPRTARS